MDKIKMNKKLEEFAKSFPHPSLEVCNSKYMFDLKNHFTMDVNANHKISLRFFIRRFNNDNNIAKGFEQALIDNFRIVKTTGDYGLIEHEFFVRNFEDVNLVIELFNSFVLMGQLLVKEN